jgi:hypothetical protein
MLLGRPAERQSLSASQAAEPQAVANVNERNLDKLAAGAALVAAQGAHKGRPYTLRMTWPISSQRQRARDRARALAGAERSVAVPPGMANP